MLSPILRDYQTWIPSRYDELEYHLMHSNAQVTEYLLYNNYSIMLALRAAVTYSARYIAQDAMITLT